MEGHDVASEQLPEEQWAYWVAARKFGWTPQQVDDCPAVLFDWLLAIDQTVEQVTADAKKRAAQQRSPNAR